MEQQQHKQTQASTPSNARRETVDSPGADKDRPHHLPSSVDSVLESIGKAITEPIRDASEDEPDVRDGGAGEGRPAS